MKCAPFLALSIFANPAFAQAPPCDGTYELFSGKITTDVMPGNTLPDADRIARAFNNREGLAGQVIRKPQSEGLHEVKVSQCGRQFVLSQNGQNMLFRQSATDETLYVAQDIGTQKAELTFRVYGHASMIGRMAGEVQGFSFDYPAAMEPRSLAMPDMEGCQGENLSDSDIDMAKSAAAQGLAMALADQGKTAAQGYTLSDYVMTSAKDSGRESSWLHLGETGRILPVKPHEDSLERICALGETGLLDPPRVRLNFKQREVDGEIYVFAQVIDIETGIVREQRETVAASTSATDRAEAMSAVMAQLDTPVGATSGGYSQ
ncbi:hypothetical protein MXMO3_02393 [Maritalea myrionectae]|uniref:DUF4412 domain-containing protein n=1 Tax=Maritalea myrionectae TaxID=454601 RepID=A0A2R4MG91_9HYPH|nr:hypothetical protein [Maritalea myrionectae]AVX04906.1 hypothetical protein MXMO3_02393 [Maritalea myrionectae]